MNEIVQQSRKYGSKATDADGRILELHGMVKLGQHVTWLGRKVGSCADDDHFKIGEQYEVCFIYPSNFDIELQGDSSDITIRATEAEYTTG